MREPLTSRQLDRAARVFGSKAHTLALLTAISLRNAEVPDSVFFSPEEWAKDRIAVLERLRRRFGAVLLAVRSSAWDEDCVGGTRAGHYRSSLDVPGWNEAALVLSISSVIGQYDEHPENVVLVQPMVTQARAFGAVTTYCVPDGAPYYAISCDSSGRPDTVTAGVSCPTTTVVYRDAWRDSVGSRDLRVILTATAELEGHFPGSPLEIEFALTAAETPQILQVRPLAASAARQDIGAYRIRPLLDKLASTIDCIDRAGDAVYGRRTILGSMPDWNPAEAIGARPRPLALSLYDSLVTRRVWRRARSLMGYRALPDVRLLIDLCGRPYVDVRASFNSFLPQGLDVGTSVVLVDAWLDRLEREPWLHDKVEFEIALTCLDFDFDATFSERYRGVLPERSCAAFRVLLRDLTRRCLAGSAPGGLANAASALRRLFQRQMGWPAAFASGRPGITHLQRMLGECRALGTLPFACAARHAFIAEALLRSAVRRGAIAPDRARELRRSFRTIPFDLAADRERLNDGLISESRFFARYGHLRPGTYDIRSAPYSATPEIFRMAGQARRNVCGTQALNLTERECGSLNRLLAETGLDCFDAAGLVRYVGRAIRLRERAKFTFTRHVSAILEAVADWGETHGIDRNALSYLTVEDLSAIVARPRGDHRSSAREMLEEKRAAFHAADAVRLSPLITQPDDVYCFTQLRSVPNFVGSGRVQASLARLDSGRKTTTVRGRVVCLECADPGFDWIFDQGAAGLVTQYGGPNSHMAVRCAEVGLPAALGCGEFVYRQVYDADELLLDCEAQMLVPIRSRGEDSQCV